MSESLFKITDHIIDCQHIRGYPRGLKRNGGKLRLAVKQYTPLNNLDPGPDSVTLIAGHANGIIKECYEPLWDELLKTAKVKIKNIWFADFSHQGASGVLNEQIQGDDPSYFDHSRDLLYMVNQLSDQITQPILGVGHSISCTSLIHLSVTHPRLFQGLALIEPMVQARPLSYPFRETDRSPALWASRRPDLWPSREAAEAAIRKTGFFRSWDPRAVDKYTQYGLRSTPTALYPDEPPSAVTLTTTKAQETWTYLRFDNSPYDPSDPTERFHWHDLSPDPNDVHINNPKIVTTCPGTVFAFEMVAYVRPSVLYLFGENSHLNPPARREEKLQRTGSGVGGSGGVSAGRVESHIVSKSSHMLPLEKVSETAALLAQWSAKQVEEYQKEEEYHRTFRSELSAQDQMALSAVSMEQIAKPPWTTRPIKNRL